MKTHTPDNLSSAFYDGPGSRAVDAAARAAIPISGIDLMMRAARAVFDVILSEYPHAESVRVYCGKGNNAGDGYLVAKLVREHGLKAEVIAIVEPDELDDDAAVAHAEAVSAGVGVVSDAAQSEFVPDLIVDALLGTGFAGEVRPAFASAISAINESGLPVVAIDLPSGVSCDTGAAQVSVVADRTVTFITHKVGLATGKGRQLAGELHFARLGVPAYVYEGPRAGVCAWRAEALAEPDHATYKHRQGHVLVVGGDEGMPGAVMMAAEAALRVGAGLVTVATHPTHAAAVVTRVPEVMTVDAASLGGEITGFDLVILGPGLGRNTWGREIYEHIANSGLPVVLDADGLYWLSQQQHWPGGALALTPHSAEAARLLKLSVAEVEADRLAAAETLAARFAARVDLKGPGSVVVTGGSTEIGIHGNPGMATAGMGDVLSGVVGGLLAGCYRQGGADADLDRLFSTAVALHSCAADRAVVTTGTRSLVATDVIRALPATISPYDEHVSL